MSIPDKQFLKTLLISSIAVFLIMFAIASKPPDLFPAKKDIHITKDTSLNKVTEELVKNNIISSPFLFKVGVVLFSGGSKILAGDYRFIKPQGVFTVAYRMVHGSQGLPKISITIPEGTNVYDMAFIFLSKLSDFNAPYFVSQAKKYEGYLFPDTYYFLLNVKTDEIINTMKNNFYKKIEPIKDQIKNSNKTLKDIVIMASIIEKETKQDESRRIVSGILWKRIENKMPLQVDAPFYYITGKAGNFTLDDLKIDSPFNTYINKGLPIAPISNPGIEAIIDTITPIETTYWYYLSDRDGNIHYAETHDGHLMNKNKYLRK